DPQSQLQPIIDKIESTAAQNQKLHSALTFELVLARDDLLVRVPQLKSTRQDLTLERLIVEEESRLTTILPKLPSAKERRVLQAMPVALGERWTIRALHLMQGSNARLVSQIPRIFAEAGQPEALRPAPDRSLPEHSSTRSPNALFWRASLNCIPNCRLSSPVNRRPKRAKRSWFPGAVCKNGRLSWRNW